MWKLQCAKALNQGISSNPKVCCNVSASGSSYLIWKFAKLGLEQLRPAAQMPHQSKTPSCLYIPLQKKAGRSRLGILGFGTGWVVDSHLEKSHHITTILRPKVPLGWTKTTKNLPVQHELCQSDTQTQYQPVLVAQGKEFDTIRWPYERKGLEEQFWLPQVCHSSLHCVVVFLVLRLFVSLIEWMNGWVGGMLDEWMNGWMDGWMDKWMDQWMNGRMADWAHDWLNGCMAKWTHELLNGWMNI